MIKTEHTHETVETESQIIFVAQECNPCFFGSGKPLFQMCRTFILCFRIFVDKHSIFRKFVVPKAMFRIRPPNNYVFTNSCTRSTQKTTMFGFTQKTTMFGFCAEYCRNVLRGTQTLVVLYFQIAFVSVVFYGKGICVVPRLEVLAEFRNALLYQRNYIRHLTMDFLNIAITIYDDGFGMCDT